MSKNKLSKDNFDQILKSSLSKIDEKMTLNQGVLRAMQQKLQFEKWFQVELFNQLSFELNKYSDNIHLEYEMKGKTGKRGKSIDIVITQNDIEFFALELKLIPTNYNVKGFAKKGKRTPEIVNDFISDIYKTCSFYHSYSLALIYPFPIDQEHRNYSDFLKQETRMRAVGELKFWNSLIDDNFVSRYYLIYKKNN